MRQDEICPKCKRFRDLREKHGCVATNTPVLERASFPQEEHWAILVFAPPRREKITGQTRPDYLVYYDETAWRIAIDLLELHRRDYVAFPAGPRESLPSFSVLSSSPDDEGA